MIGRHTSYSIDVIRGLAALGVIWGHSIYGFSWKLELNGAFWVWIFLPISGYLIGKGFAPQRYGLGLRGYRRFLWNRALRIIPLAELGLLLGLLIETASGTRDTSIGLALRQFVFLSPMNNMSLAGPLWTVAAEIHFYIASIVLAWVLARLAPWWAGWLLWLISIWVGFHGIALIGDNLSQPRTLLGNLPFFVFGLILASDRYDAILKTGRAVKLVLVALPIGVAWYLNNWKADYFWRWGRHTGMPLGGAAICALVVAAIVLITDVREGSNRWLKWTPLPMIWRALAWCGFYTYGIYVYHSVIGKANSAIFHIPLGPGRLALLLCATLLAPISYRFFEKPIMRLKVR